MNPIDRYARQRLIEWWDQDRLRAARVLVAGAGALGNEVLKNLALLGVGHLLIVDFDHIEPSNLSRAVLFSETDVGRAKVHAAEEALARINPETSVRTIAGDLFYDVGLGHYRHCDLAIGCLDNLAARSQVGLGCALAGIPFLDGGMWSLGGEVRWFTAGEGPCFDCTLSAEDRERAGQRRSCSGFRNPGWEAAGRMPTVISTAAVIGGMLAQEAAKYLCGHPVAEGKAIVYNGQSLTLHQAELPRNPRCMSNHEPYQNVVALNLRCDEMTPRRLFDIVRNGLSPAPGALPEDDGMILELDRDFLATLHCPQCGTAHRFDKPMGVVSESERICPDCGAVRAAENFQSIDENSSYAERFLSELGVPQGEVLAVRVGRELCFYELTGDIAPWG